MNVCEEHKTEREARGPEGSEREARDENVPAKRADFLFYFCGEQNCTTRTVNFILFFFLYERSIMLRITLYLPFDETST